MSSFLQKIKPDSFSIKAGVKNPLTNVELSYDFLNDEGPAGSLNISRNELKDLSFGLQKDTTPSVCVNMTKQLSKAIAATSKFFPVLIPAHPTASICYDHDKKMMSACLGAEKDLKYLFNFGAEACWDVK